MNIEVVQLCPAALRGLRRDTDRERGADKDDTVALIEPVQCVLVAECAMTGVHLIKEQRKRHQSGIAVGTVWWIDAQVP